MRIKVYYLLSGDIAGIYVLDFEGEINLDNIESAVRSAKRRFDMPGKLFTVLADRKVFHVAKVGKIWKTYELKEAENNEH